MKAKNLAAVMLGKRSQEIMRKRLGNKAYKERMRAISLKRGSIKP